MSINRVTLTGNLTRDAELRQSGGGMAIVKMRLAVNDRRKNASTGQWEDSPNYIDVTMFGSRGEALSRYLTKGKQIAIDGKLRWHEWESQAGEKRSALEVIADDIELLGGRDTGGASSGPSRSSGVSEEDFPAAEAAPEDAGGEEIPF